MTLTLCDLHLEFEKYKYVRVKIDMKYIPHMTPTQ